MHSLSLLPFVMLLAPATLEKRSDRVSDLFVQVCLKGEARFRKGEVETVSSNSVPGPLARLVFNRPGQYYQVRRPAEAWIAVTDQADDRDHQRVCRVGAKYIDVRQAADKVRAYLRLPPLPRGPKLTYYEEYFLDGGARFEIERTQYFDFVILNSYVLTPEAADKARRRLTQ